MSIEQAKPRHAINGTWRRWAERGRLVAGSLRDPSSARHRFMWPWDCRSTGLVVFAEQGWIPNREFTDNKGSIEIAPPLLGLKMLPGRRVYLCKPLAGQTLKTFEDAAEPLRWRWKASSVTATPHPTMRGLIVLDVVTGEALDRPLTHPGG
ncbi:MAG: hypothetical protein AB7L13_23860 [Acidimicrobiia bacterium]